MQNLVRNALGGKNALTIEDIYNTEKMIERAKDEKKKER